MAKRWDDPFRTGFAGQYDPGTMYGLIYRARAGDLAAKNHLSLAGFYDQQGNDIYGGNQNYQQAVTNWAKAKNLGVYGGPDAFQWNSAWAAPGFDTVSPFFSSAWDSFWTDQPGQAKVDQPQDNKPTNPLGTTGGGGQQTAQGFRVNVPNGYGKPRAYYYNGHAVQGDQGQWITLPVDYNEAADTRRWEYNGKMEESTMRRAVRYAFDDVRDRRSGDFNQALIARLKQFYAEAGGQGVGYTINAASPSGGPTMPGTGQQGGTGTGQQGTGQTGTGGQQGTGQTLTYTNPITGQTVTGQGNDFARNLILASDSDARNDYVLRALGIDPQNGGLYLDSILRTISPMAGRFIHLQGIGGDTSAGPMINTQGNLDTLAGWLRNPGGMANVQNWARGQLAGATASGSELSRLSDANAQLDTIGQLLAMQYSGVNPILVQAYADYFDRSRRGYRDYNFNQIGRGSIQNPIDWLRSSQWADLLG